jgi:hypothetical protein
VLISRLAALADVGNKEGQESIDNVFRELAMDNVAFPAEPLKGEWI